MKPIYHPFAIVVLFIICLICAVIIWLCMVIDWICRILTLPEPFNIIKGIKDLEATDTDAYIN